MRSLMLVPFAFLAACSQSSSGDTAPTPAANAGAEPTLSGVPAAPIGDTREARVEAWVKGAYPDMGLLMLKWGSADLDGDGTDEVLAYVGGPMLCGTGGCNLVVLTDDGANFAKVGDISVSQMPIGVLDTRTNGWRDLAVTTYGGGEKERIMKVPFDGKSYAGNPTVAPATPLDMLGTEVIAEGELEKLD